MTEKDLQILLSGGYIFTVDIASQIIELAKLLEKNELNSISNRSIQSSIVLMLFNMLEGYANFIASLILELDKGIIDAPKTKYQLNIIEQNVLKEEERKINFKKCTVEIRKNSFVTTLDKIKIVLTMLPKLYGEEYKLNIGGQEWQMIQSLKIERDKLTHLKLDLNMLPTLENYETPDCIHKANPTLNINNKIIFEGIVAIRWYFNEAALQLQKILSKHLLYGPDLLLYKLLHELNKTFKYYKNDTSFKKNIELCRFYNTDYTDNSEKVLSWLTSNEDTEDLIDPN